MAIEIPVHDRKLKQDFREKVYGERWISWAYENNWGRRIAGLPAIQKLTSLGAALWMKSPFSKPRIEPFIRDFDINMNDFVVPAGGFDSFNDFFIRQLRPGARPFPSAASEMGAPAEGRLSVFPIKDGKSLLFVKGATLPVSQLVGSKMDASSVEDGHAFVFRLCPVDYHRFHFPDSGRVGASQRLPGVLHSVNPLSIKLRPDVFLLNERQLSVFESDHFGRLLYLEVGAVCVGAIVQTHDAQRPILRGQEKGYFEFGGSTVILLTPPQLRPDADLLERSQKGEETLVRVGERIAALEQVR
jgi:phosphatidylserine decarboxylase